MQIARLAPPPTGPKRFTEQRIRRRIRCTTFSPERAERSQGPTPGLACVGTIATSPRISGRVTTVAKNRFGTSRPYQALVDVDPAAGAPIHAVVAIEDPFVDEIAAERRVIVEQHPHDRID